MSISLLETENGGIDAALGNALPRHLDCLLADCLNCALDEVPDSASRENQCPGGGQANAPKRRRAWFGRPLPGEHMDA